MEVKADRSFIIEELAASRHPSCLEILDAIKSLPNYSPSHLLKQVQKIKLLTPPDGENNQVDEKMNGNLWARAVYLFSLEVNKSFLKRLEKEYIVELKHLDPHIEYWSKSPGISERLWNFLFGPKDQLGKKESERTQVLIKGEQVDTGVYSGKSIKLKLLRKLKRKYEKQLGRIHRYLWMLEDLDDFSGAELEPLMYTIKAVYKFFSDRTDDILAQQVLTPWNALDLLEQSLKSVPSLRQFFRSCLEPVAMPNHFRRHWLTYIFGITATSLIVYAGYKNRKELAKLSYDGQRAFRSFIREQVSDPLTTFADSVIKTFKTSSTNPSTMSTLQQSKASLQKMIQDFAALEVDYIAAQEGKTRQQILQEIPIRAKEGDMNLVMTKYTNDVSKPIKGLITGDLLQGLLIQIQKVKLDGEEAMVTLEKLLKANELNFQLMATIPGVLFLVLFGFGAKTTLAFVFRTPLPTKLYKDIRRKLREIHHLLILSGSFSNPDDEDANTGALLVTLDYLEYLVKNLHSKSEQALMMEDIDMLASLNFSTWQKNVILDQMYRTYKFLR